MADIDVAQELTQINTELESLVAKANELNQERETLMQQIHNLNGIAMYLRGKQQEEQPDSTIGTVDIEDLERSEGYPEEILAT